MRGVTDLKIGHDRPDYRYEYFVGGKNCDRYRCVAGDWAGDRGEFGWGWGGGGGESSS
jgi:hypothetical protein